MLSVDKQLRGIHWVCPEKEKKATDLRWKGFAEKEGLKPGMKKWESDGC